MTLGLAGAINREMVVVKFVYDRLIQKFRYGTRSSKTFVSPYCKENVEAKMAGTIMIHELQSKL